MAKRIIRQKDVCGGRFTFEGTRMWPEIFLSFEADGYTIPQMLAEYTHTTLTAEDIEAGLRWCHRRDQRLIRWLLGKRLALIQYACDRWGDC